MKVELQILDPRLAGWGFPSWGSKLAAGLDLHACLDGPLIVEPQAAAVLIPAGIAFRIGDPDWCAVVLPRSGLGHREGLVLGNAVGLIDADYEGPCLISAWNRNPPQSGRTITVRPGDRIAQLVFTRIARPELAIVTAFSSKESQEQNRSPTRGAAGFGSTGVGAACPGRLPGRHSSL
ncbi:MAG TPA: dUTP diphosphatase [Stellaceae bacterium]|jgi:dUTP pyrophosphatase|nr:dUTP diphosphatase [Stellaceae bacterium]